MPVRGPTEATALTSTRMSKSPFCRGGAGRTRGRQEQGDSRSSRGGQAACAGRSVELIRAVAAVFMADLIHGLSLARTAVEAVGRVEHQARLLADVLVGVDHAGRDDYQHGAARAHFLDLPDALGGRTGPAVPEIEAKPSRSEKAKAVGLFDVLVRPTGGARTGHRQVGHRRVKNVVHLVLTEQLAQPA